MKDKRVKSYNVYYKDIHFHPLCDYFLRCQRINGKTEWHQIYKYPSQELILITKEKAKEIYKEEMSYWYK